MTPDLCILSYHKILGCKDPDPAKMDGSIFPPELSVLAGSGLDPNPKNLRIRIRETFQILVPDLLIIKNILVFDPRNILVFKPMKYRVVWIQRRVFLKCPNLREIYGSRSVSKSTKSFKFWIQTRNIFKDLEQIFENYNLECNKSSFLVFQKLFPEKPGSKEGKGRLEVSG